MAKGVNVRMDSVKAARRRPSADRGSSHTCSLQLLRAQDAVLQLGQLREGFCGDFVSVSDANLTQNGHGVDPGP